MTIFFSRLHAVSIVVVTVLVLCLPTSSESGSKPRNKSVEKKFQQGENNLKGRARWEWTLLEDGKQVDKGTFMGYVDGRICHGREQKEVGSWKWVKAKAKDKINATFTYPKLAGSWNFVLVKTRPPTYEGKAKKGTRRIHLEIVND